MAVKTSLWTQTLLRPEYLNPRILVELNIESLDTKIYPINTIDLDLINELL